MKWILPFLLIVSIGEIIANYQNSILKVQAVTANYLIAVIESAFYGFIFYRLTNARFFKKVIIAIVIISELGYICGYYFDSTSLSYFFPNIIFSGFLIATISLVYIYLRFSEDDKSLLISESGFWMAAGVTLFYSGASISFAFYESIYRNNLSLFGEKLLNIAPRFLSIILYICISISIILCKQKKKI